MCGDTINKFLGSLGLGASQPSQKQAPAQSIRQATDHSADATVKVADGNTAYDRVGGGARIGSNRKAGANTVPGLGL